MITLISLTALITCQIEQIVIYSQFITHLNRNFTEKKRKQINKHKTIQQKQKNIPNKRMIKHLIFTFLILSSIYCDCSTYTTTSSCDSDKNCTWKPDTTKDKCISAADNCSGKSKTDCKGTCSYTDEVHGGCGPQAHYCGTIGDTFCKTSTICTFTPGSEICQNKRSGYGCGSLPNETACTSATYCSALGTCTTPASRTCDPTTPTTCQSNGACDYKEISREGCYTSDNYCSDSACDANDPFCIKKVKDSGCSQKTLSTSCRSYNDTGSCTADQNCYWDTTYNDCYQKECDGFKNQPDCDGKTYCGWWEDFDCKPDQTKCSVKLNKADCDAVPQTPPGGGMFSPCVWQDVKFTCDAKDFSLCPTHKDKLTCTQGGCDFAYTGCIDGDAGCGSKSLSDCTTTYSATCEKGNLPGTCTDKVGACSGISDSATCGSSNCQWQSGTPASCTNTVTCSALAESGCKADTTNCSWVTGGTCISKTFDDVKNEALSQTLLQITLLFVIAFLMI
ncbi:hypothetical protein TTHERM_00196640 (macronuclear) [Tetrahymena thermophila SB210]|uniref:Uncharacterized protein n=1 Tax=Tetrahymena thermophila (strain SB210) TaxID=312017 RepID=Q23JX0_TETTS|nr:hypothetical protein TTHERM_00196640 [Tetrahymena thermophila SB210]EAR97073.2 hypothetical protein TTHERM_00196640 [Tetrahymena thermophila SB210]|eukprot:XP_001017318.2 hypothetical protein TTHERM_00196640 [Tetrahymena thermophila SB210]